jgi:hypothetical protein
MNGLAIVLIPSAGRAGAKERSRNQSHALPVRSEIPLRNFIFCDHTPPQLSSGE